MKECKITLIDEVNCQVEGLDFKVRKDCSDALKFFDPSARYTTAFKMKRWDGYDTYMNMGGFTYTNLLDRIIKGGISKQTFNEICLVSGRKYSSVRRRLNQMLKDLGKRQSLRDLIVSDKEKKRRDKLGFSIGDLPVEKQEN